MRTKLFTIVLPITVALLTWSSYAGELSADLTDLVSRAGTGEMVKVWIKLPRAVDSRRLSTSAVQTATTRSVRHKNIVSELKKKHSAVQQPIIDELQNLLSVGKVRAIHSYWIVNVIETEVTIENLTELSLREDIEFIVRPPEIRGVGAIESVTTTTFSPAGVETNLSYIKADSAWKAGFTGAGRLICSFDSGVEGIHNALKNNWKGLDGDSAAAWFDPFFLQPFPHTQGSGIAFLHGTHTMGIMVGVDTLTGDTIGVAPDAQWISASVIDQESSPVIASAILRAFEWAADPDGNPNTIDDVPDVINHSWGFGRFGFKPWNISCQNIFYDAIDATEALGIVNVFSAGNDGNNVASIVNPGNRANDSLDCFAVGNLNHSTNTIEFGSSRGPSDCNGAVKPNVVAPGAAIRSSYPNNGYGFLSGTSMAAPHVSGLVALLRQKNPNATVTEIKKAILTSATSHPNFGTLPNNNYGWGRIDCMAALNALSGPQTSLNVRVYSFDYPAVAPGDTLRGTVVVEAIGGDINSVSGTIIGNSPSLNVLSGTAFFGSMLHSDTVRSTDSIIIVVSDTLTPGQIISIDYQLSATGWSDTTKLHLIIGPPTGSSVITHNTGQIQFSISNFGVYGLGPASFVPGPGVGFSFNGTTNELYEAGLMIGVPFDRVSSGVHSYILEPNHDFKVAAGGNLIFTSPGPVTFEQTFSAFNDSNSTNPLGLRIEQETFADTGQNSDFIVMRFVLRNQSTVPISNLYVGLYFNWDAGGGNFFTQTVGGYDAADQIGWVAYYNGGAPKDYRGMKLIQGNLATALTQDDALLSLIPAETGGNGYSNLEKYQSLTDGFTTANTYINTPKDLVQVTAAGPISLAVGAVDTVAFAILAGSTYADIQSAGVRASSVLTSVETDNSGISSIPSSFTLHQNYPNPFNPSTTISFDLVRRSDYKLSIYNPLGRLVFSHSERADAGTVKINWDASDFASGVYLYRVEIGDQVSSRKMLLLK